MTDVASLRRQLDQLRAAFRSGAVSIDYDGKRVTYRDTAGMLAAIASLEQEIAAAEGHAKPRTVIVRSEKGWL